METIQLHIPQVLRLFIEERVQAGGYEGADEYLRELIRLDQRRFSYTPLELDLLEGLASEPETEMTTDDWAKIREQVQQLAATKIDSSGIDACRPE